MATHFILGSRARRSRPALPCTPESRGGEQKERWKWGGGPAESPPTCGQRGAAPEQQQPRAAPHGREEPGGAGPGGCGREPSPLGGGMRRQQSSGGTGALYVSVLLGRRARSGGAGGGEEPGHRWGGGSPGTIAGLAALPRGAALRAPAPLARASAPAAAAELGETFHFPAAAAASAFTTSSGCCVSVPSFSMGSAVGCIFIAPTPRRSGASPPPLAPPPLPPARPPLPALA